VTKLSRPESPELVKAMKPMNEAVDQESASPTRDPVAELFELLTVRDQVAQVAGEILRSLLPPVHGDPRDAGSPHTAA
jgi:hypothetical protein